MTSTSAASQPRHDAASQAPHAVRFHNTLGRELQALEPLEAGRVQVYTCGPTVYSFAHIGNLRAFLFEDLLCRALRFLGYEVEHVMNITDVDDKTLRQAQEAGCTLDEYTQPYIDAFFDDLDTLQVVRANRYPRATEHVSEMIALIERLEAGEFTYRSDDGSVFFRISADQDYGRLSGIDLEQVQQGERVANDEYGKEDARDFVLWKAQKPGEPGWDSPWGPGRPGWHLECSAMAMKYFGETFDIHCGGVDNIFPHHENEIAQSECATGKLFVKHWLHSEHLIVDGQKMSKSLGNFYTLRDLLDRGVDPRAFRYLILSVHYRQKLNFTFESLDGATAALRRLDDLRFRLEGSKESAEARDEVGREVDRFLSDFAAALADDLNSSAALAALFGLVRQVNKVLDGSGLGAGDRERILTALARADEVLGVIDDAPWRPEQVEGLSDAEIDDLVARRQTARQQRDFAEADRIRDELSNNNIVIEDSASGSRWRRA